ncbi:Methyltransferase type 11 [[Leptolyngbya] sp. PCC 7376]|uniref:class I SAM-dependent methyltransferase n=1 Tax=[Leptolyngbya] sp. PCC 7376 TaxID=111781 RepID=UPI00029ED362|nr:class I SAM-dependent methyltransferase [[Leptolyngbya] sp. PCC 7376]AFY37586.1 Methyltransferase type 11 [[Leptolyngbya] sp. PCC 7376]
MGNILKAYLAKQLGHPSGWFGQMILRLLNRSNETMNRLTFQQLTLAKNQHVLEIGFGGGELIQRCLISDYWPEISAVDPAITAISFAEKRFRNELDSGRLQISQASGENLPFSDEFFDRIATVNTLYFWSEPKQVLASCYRVLKPAGKLVITYNNKTFLEKTGATNYGFQAYAPDEVQVMLKVAGFQDIQTVVEDSPYDGQFFCTSGSKN